MRKSLLLIISILIFMVNVQGKDDVIFTITKYNKIKDSIEIEVVFENISKDTIVFYKINECSICCSLVQLIFINVKSKELHEIFPCRLIIDIGSIVLNSSNTIYLANGESFHKILKFSIYDVSPYLESGAKYELIGKLFFQEVNFETSFQNVFNDNLTSNKLYVIYP